VKSATFVVRSSKKADVSAATEVPDEPAPPRAAPIGQISRAVLEKATGKADHSTTVNACGNEGLGVLEPNRPLSCSASCVEEEHIVFFTAGNPEVHRLLRAMGRSEEAIYQDVSKSFRVASILGDLVLQSSSNYYESNVTRRLARDYELLFQHGIAQFVIRKDYHDFVTDREAACSVYPRTADYRGYFGKEGDRRLRELNEFGFVHHRSGTMGGTIDAFWASGLNGQIGSEAIVPNIQQNVSLGVPDRDTLLHTLQELPTERMGDPFVWDIVTAAASQHGIALPKALARELRLYLLRTYFRAASALYRPAIVVLNPSQYLGEILAEPAVSRYNTALFLAFCSSLGIRSIVEHLTPAQIIDVKGSLEFVPFRRAYFTLIDAARSLEGAKIAILKELMGEQFNYALFRTQSFAELDHAVHIGVGSRLGPAEQNGQAYDRLRRAIADPDGKAFWLLRDTILNTYRNSIEALATHHQGRLPIQGESTVIVTDKLEVTMGNKNLRDHYEIKQAAAVGPNALAHDVILNQTWQQVKGNIDLETLAAELAVLRRSLQSITSSADEAIELGAIAQAESEARAGKGEQALAALRKVGKWGLGTAEKIGVGLAVFAIKHACGL
jgi:hypothetical protein